MLEDGFVQAELDLMEEEGDKQRKMITSLGRCFMSRLSNLNTDFPH